MENESFPKNEELIAYLRTSEAHRALAEQFLASGKIATSQLARFEATRTITMKLVFFVGVTSTRDSAEGVRTPLFSFERRMDGAERGTCQVGSKEVQTEIGFSLSPLRFFPIGNVMAIVEARKKLDWFKPAMTSSLVEDTVVAFPGC